MVRKVGVVLATGRTLPPVARAFHGMLNMIDFQALLVDEQPQCGAGVAGRP